MNKTDSLGLFQSCLGVIPQEFPRDSNKSYCRASQVITLKAYTHSGKKGIEGKWKIRRKSLLFNNYTGKKKRLTNMKDAFLDQKPRL